MKRNVHLKSDSIRNLVSYTVALCYTAFYNRNMPPNGCFYSMLCWNYKVLTDGLHKKL